MSVLPKTWVVDGARRLEPLSEREQRLQHDLRQSLCAVTALVSIIERNPLLVAEALARLNQIHHEADWMAEILANANQTQVLVVDIGEGVSDSWAVVAAAAPCTVRLLREPATNAFVDPVALRRAVRNLIENAVRAAGRHGCVEVRVLGRSDEVVIEVADSGSGFGKMPPQQGLGLVTVRRFAVRFGGVLTIGRSELGGALVSLRLPSASIDRASVQGDPL